MKKGFIIVCVLSIFLSGCHENGMKTMNASGMKEIHRDIGKCDNFGKELIEDPKATQLFEEIFNITNMEHHEAYRFRDELDMNLYFNNKVTRKEIINSKNFVMRGFVLKRGYPISGSYPYGK